MIDPFVGDISSALLGNYKDRTVKRRKRRMKRKLHLLKINVIWFLGWLQTTLENATGIAKIRQNKFFRGVQYGR